MRKKAKQKQQISLRNSNLVRKIREKYYHRCGPLCYNTRANTHVPIDTITHRLRTERRNIHALDSFDAIRSTIQSVRRFRSFNFDFDSSILVDAPLSLPNGLAD